MAATTKKRPAKKKKLGKHPSPVHRHLHLASPEQRGDDVRALQAAINTRLKARGFTSKLKRDGVYGAKTSKAAHLLGFILGLSSSRLGRIERGLIRMEVQRVLRGEHKRTGGDRKRAKERRGQIAKKKAKQSNGAKQALRWALSQRDTHEGFVPNCGSKIDDWQRECGYAIGCPSREGVSWCGCFVSKALTVAGVQGVTERIRHGYCPSILADAQAGRNGFVRTVSIADAQPGDLVLYDWNHDGVMDHVGMVIERRSGYLLTIEGNTSSTNAGSQSNGGGVYVRSRPDYLVAAIVRPNYA